MIVVPLAVAMALTGPLAVRRVSQPAHASMRPQWNAIGLVSAMVVVGAGTVGALATVAWPVAARIGFVASLGRWSSGQVGRYAPVPIGVSAVAALLGVAVLTRMAAVISRELRGVWAAERGPAGEQLIVIDDPVPFAHSVYGWGWRPDRLVVSSGLLQSLDDHEREAVLAHERAHLRNHHAVFRLVAALAVAANPLQRRCRRELDFQLERWADERAAHVTSRSVTARAVGRTALAQARMMRSMTSGSALALDGSSVPARVGALLDPPPDRGWRDLGCYLLVILVSGALLLVGVAYAESFVDILQRAR
jgi:hypothetical protein